MSERHLFHVSRLEAADLSERGTVKIE